MRYPLTPAARLRQAKEACRNARKEVQDLFASISARFLRLTIRLAQPAGSRCHGYLILQICDFSWKIPLYRADPLRSAFTREAFEPAETP